MKSTTFAFAAGVALAVIPLGSQVESARADGPPKLDVERSCVAAARGAVSIGRDQEACMDDERAAQESLTKNWAQYSLAHKTQCVGMTAQGGPSYVELISCLEIMTDAAAIQKSDPLVGEADAKSHRAPPNRRANRSSR
jgi:hypothetical protein